MSNFDLISNNFYFFFTLLHQFKNVLLKKKKIRNKTFKNMAQELISGNY